jgi:acyl CoA:acetate/3-ketoacid CoA transferase alpha subunit
MSRYTVGGYTDMQQARALRDEMIKLGITDVFVIAYKDGVRHHTVIIE